MSCKCKNYLTSIGKPKNKIDCIAWLLLNVFGCKFCETCRDKPCDIKDGECCTDNIANYIREAVKEENKPAADVVELPEGGIGNLSDGYHTFNELYHHRAILFSVICNSMPNKAWKSKLHDTGDMFDGMFIVGIETPEGQATYHYDIEPYWDMFKVKELEKAPKWDGHTPQEAIERIAKISADMIEVVRCKDCKKRYTEECPVMFWDCGELMGETQDNDYCSYGERREE